MSISTPSSVAATISASDESPGSRPTLVIRTIGSRAQPSARTMPPVGAAAPGATRAAWPAMLAESRPDSTPTQIPSRTMSTGAAGVPSSS